MGYLAYTLTPDSLKRLADNAVTMLDKVMENKLIEFDFIAIRGLSGAMIAPFLSLHINKPIVVVRKKDDNTHGCPVEFPNDALIDTEAHTTYNYLIVDDGTSTGSTINGNDYRIT